MDAQPIIQISGLSKIFGSGENQVVALKDVDLTINQGEIFGVIGLSGAGKSTLVRCINLLETPTEGRVSVAGQEMTALSGPELRRARQSIGMIFQGFNLLMQRTALENICFPLEIAGWKKEACRQRAWEMLEIVELSDKAKAYPSQLSGGQKQRVAIARALAANPQVLLCDEATSALDPTTTRSILALIKDLNTRLGVTVVVITHEMKVVEQICDRVAIISQSRIVESGPVAEIFLHPQTAVAKSLLYPDGEKTIHSFGSGGPLLRLIYDGNVDRPIIASMALATGAPVSIIYSASKHLDNKIYGHTVVQLPENQTLTPAILAYLDSEGIAYQWEREAK